jgi:uncharacterized protein (TIGR00661 family)
MRILYGVTGEGLGHAMRSRVVVQHLRAAGHDVKVVASGRAFDYLSRHLGGDVAPIRGLAMTYASGGVSRARTVARTGRIGRAAIREAIELYRGPLAAFQPDVIITDFDSLSHVFGVLFGRPVISIDHQHVIDRCAHAPDIACRLPRDFAITRAFVRAKLPGCAHYVVTSFYFPAIARDRTTLVGPILRPEVLALTPSRGDHVVVYQTGVTAPALLAALHAVPDQPFVLYDRAAQPQQERNVSIRAFDEGRFLADLASARAVICNGGYTTISEALYLGKPVLSVPLRHQGEQELNAAYLEALGLGRAADRLDAAQLRAFLSDHPRSPSGAAAPVVPGNQAALSRIDALLAEAA